MRTYDFRCPAHPEQVVPVLAQSASSVSEEQRQCPTCGSQMVRYFGSSEIQVALKGGNWPKRDIKETSKRKRRSAELGRKQKKIWAPRMPKLNLDPDVQKEFKTRVAKAGTALKVHKV